MKILVAVTEVVEIADDFEIEGTVVSKEYRSYDLNEWDDYAVETAIQLKESGEADEVVSVTIGPRRTEESIRHVLAKGVDRAIRIWDDALADQGLLDVASKTKILEAVVTREQPDIILTGVQANDDAWGATGVSLAHSIGYGWSAVVTELDLDDNLAHVRRELEDGVEELVEIQLPAVFTIQTGINEPRYASLRAIRQAQSKMISHRSLADLDLELSDVESSITLTEMFEPETEGTTEYLEGNDGQQAMALAKILYEKGVVSE